MFERYAGSNIAAGWGMRVLPRIIETKSRGFVLNRHSWDQIPQLHS